jgi:hypothetical protein
MGDNKVTSSRVEHSTVLVLRTVVLHVIDICVTAGRLRLRLIKVLLVERSNAVRSLFRVLLGVIGRHGT